MSVKSFKVKCKKILEGVSFLFLNFKKIKSNIFSYGKDKTQNLYQLNLGNATQSIELKTLFN